MREQYLTQLKKLHEAMLEMGELCQQAIGLAHRGPGECKTPLSPRSGDRWRDRQAGAGDRISLPAAAFEQQPVASDLRDISAALKMISDMERIGDQASDIAELADLSQGPAGTLQAAPGADGRGGH